MKQVNNAQRVANQLDSEKANDSAVIHKTGNESVAGKKTFSTAPASTMAPTDANDLIRKTDVDVELAYKATTIEATVSFASGVFTLSGGPSTLPEVFSVRFTSPVAYTQGNTLRIGSKTITVYGTDGKALPNNAFASGVLVNMDVDYTGGRAFFKAGGGAANWKLFHGSTSSPPSTEQNGLYVVTSHAPNKWLFSKDVLSDGTWTQKSSLTDARHGTHGMSAISGGTSYPDYIFYIGGRDNDFAVKNAVTRYTISTGIFTTCTNIPEVMYAPDLAVYNGIIYALYSGTLYAYSISSNTWTARASGQSLLFRTFCADNNGLLIAAGGHSSAPVATSNKYTISSNVWSAIASLPMALSMSRSYQPINKTTIIRTVGGYASGNSSNATLSCYDYTVSSNAWSQSLTTPYAFYSGQLCPYYNALNIPTTAMISFFNSWGSRLITVNETTRVFSISAQVPISGYTNGGLVYRSGVLYLAFGDAENFPIYVLNVSDSSQYALYDVIVEISSLSSYEATVFNTDTLQQNIPVKACWQKLSSGISRLTAYSRKAGGAWTQIPSTN